MNKYQKQWDMVEFGLNNSRATFIYGPPSVGKTMAAMQLGQKANKPVYKYALSKGTFVQDLMGTWVPRKAGMEFQPGAAIQAWVQGGVLIVDELGRGSAEVQDWLLGLAESEDSAMMTLPDTTQVKPANGFVLVATSNTPLESLSNAMQSRFVEVVVSGPAPGAIAKLNEYLPRMGDFVYDSWAKQNEPGMDIRKAMMIAKNPVKEMWELCYKEKGRLMYAAFTTYDVRGKKKEVKMHKGILRAKPLEIKEKPHVMAT